MSVDAISRRIQRAYAQIGSSNRGEARTARARLAEMRARYPEYFPNGRFQPRFKADAVSDGADWDEQWIIRQLAHFGDATLLAISAAALQPDGRYKIAWADVAATARPRLAAFVQWPEAIHHPVFLSEMGIAARALLVARPGVVETERAEQEGDHELDALKAAAPFMDEGFSDPKGWKPSEIIQVAYCITATRSFVLADAKHLNRAKAYATRMLEEARRRYAAGFYANPLGEPVKRPAQEACR
ncbi:MAG TPA: hypothetical protein VF503_09020 [Sphingobium sp.]|uniref:hypothetical protein n=1 Tax=Sphingobium sp. TaxID=1912891 RepID=UPI002ED19BA9